MVLPSGVALWLAPTKAGGFCFYLANGGGQCDAQRALSFWPLFSLGGSYTRDGVITGGPVTVAGSTTVVDARTVEIRFEDGAVADVPVVWISAPIDAGFFAYQVPRERWAKGHRPVEAVLRDGDSKELASDSSAFHVPVFRRGAATGLAPCIARAGGATCLAGAIGSGRGLQRTLDASRKGNESGGSDR